MKYSEIKEVKSFCEGLASEPDWREVVESWGESDFEVDNVRFIDDDNINDTLREELENDEYILGCFNAWFLAGILEIDQDVIEEFQKSEAFEALGKLIIRMDKMDELVEEYVSHDGYGHHFNSYDGNEEEIEIAGVFYHVFDNR